MSKIKPKMEVTFKVVYYFVFNVFFLVESTDYFVHPSVSSPCAINYRFGTREIEIYENIRQEIVRKNWSQALVTVWKIRAKLQMIISKKINFHVLLH